MAKEGDVKARRDFLRALHQQWKERQAELAALAAQDAQRAKDFEERMARVRVEKEQEREAKRRRRYEKEEARRAREQEQEEEKARRAADAKAKKADEEARKKRMAEISACISRSKYYCSCKLPIHKPNCRIIGAHGRLLWAGAEYISKEALEWYHAQGGKRRTSFSSSSGLR